MTKTILICAFMACASSAQATEGVLQLSARAASGGVLTAAAPGALTYGSDISTLLYLKDWFALEGLVYGLRTSKAYDWRAPIAFDSWRLGFSPTVHLAAPATLWPRILGGAFIPALDVGLGVEGELQRNRQRAGSRVGRAQEDLFRINGSVLLGIGLDAEVANEFVLSFRARATTPVNAFGEHVEVLASFGLGFLLHVN